MQAAGKEALKAGIADPCRENANQAAAATAGVDTGACWAMRVASTREHARGFMRVAGYGGAFKCI